MYGTVIEFDTLSDSDRAGTENKHFLASLGLHCLALSAEYGIVIRGGRSKFSGTGIYHLVDRLNAVIITHFLNLFLRLAGQTGNHIVGELQSLCLF